MTAVNVIETGKSPATRSLARRRLLAPFSTLTGKVQVIGIIILGILICMAVLAPVLSQHGPKDLVCTPFETPGRDHILGCNDVGQDLWSQLLYGTQVSLFVGLLVAALSTVVATILALISGYTAGAARHGSGILSGSWIDHLIMRLVDVSLSLPFLPLVIVLGVYFGASVQTQVLVITLVMWAHPVRELRSQVLSIRSMTYVEASRSMGASGWFIGLRHILPELAPLIVPQFVRIAHNAILVEASLSFLGLGDPLQNSWGSTLYHANARAAFLTGSWTYWIVPPGLAIGFTVLSFAFIGYGFDASLGSQKARRKSRHLKNDAQTLASVVPAADMNHSNSCLSLRGLTVDYPTENGVVHAVRGIDLDIARGELLGLVGESGSGKTSIGMAVLNLLREPAEITSGSIRFQGRELVGLPLQSLQELRSRQISLIPQSAMNALNPVMNIRAQIAEALQLAGYMDADERDTLSAFWMKRVGLEPEHLDYFPHELSGGMRQRAVIAIALCRRPDFVVADEPTTGLDVLVQEEIMQLLVGLQREMNLTILFITHNLPLIARHCDRLSVMLAGRIVETGQPGKLSVAASHSHTRALFDSLPAMSGAKRWARETDSRNQTPTDSPLLELRRVCKQFDRVGGGNGWNPFSKTDGVRAIDDVSLTLNPGDTLGLVGASGAGKSTIARLIAGQISPDSGKVLYRGIARDDMPDSELQAARQAVHIVYQDPYQSLNNRMTIADLVAEPLRIRGETNPDQMMPQIRAALEAVQLPSDEDFLSRLPVFLSGGQRQRVAFARAVVARPAIIIADEPTSMLDQSIRIEIMDLMENLRQQLGTAILFITHDIVLARHFCDRLIVLRNGQAVEEGDADEVILSPREDYTRAMIAAA